MAKEEADMAQVRRTIRSETKMIIESKKMSMKRLWEEIKKEEESHEIEQVLRIIKICTGGADSGYICSKELAEASLSAEDIWNTPAGTHTALGLLLLSPVPADLCGRGVWSQSQG